MKSLLSATLKTLRKEYGLTQEDLALKCGVGLNFVRQLEQGKPTLRMDKVNQVLAMFGYKNIGFNGKFYTFPYFLVFLLNRFIAERK